MKSQNSTLLFVAGIVGFLGAGGLLAFSLYFQAALGQEKDTLEVIKAIAKMELTQSNVKAIASNPNRLLVRSFSSLRTHLENQGWTFKDQFGAAILYERGSDRPGRSARSDRLNARCIMFSGRYTICNLHQPSR